MDNQLSSQPSAKEFTRTQIDPHAYLRPQMRVVGAQNCGLGKIVLIERDDSTGDVVALTVRHGLLGRQSTRVPAKNVKWVNQDSVVLDLNRAAFKRLKA